jgi:hypothetical protein
MRLRIPSIDAFSFLLGFILSALISWIISILRPTFRQIIANARLRRAEKKAKASTFNAVEERYRQMLLLKAQGMHLAAPLFSLDEILIPPLLLAPPPYLEPGAPPYIEDITDETVPYLPSWPELAAIYSAPTMTLSEALSGNSDIILVGHPGMGKTVTLANLASSLARRDLDTGMPQDTLPFLIHAADLDIPINKDNPLNAVIEMAAEKASVFDLPRVPDFIQRAFSEGRAFLLLDGVDELTPDLLKNAVDFIRFIKQTFPKTRIITTASIEFLDGLLTLNFIPFALAAWKPEQRTEFLEKWADLWTRHVPVESWEQIGGHVDHLLLNSWLKADSNTLSPLELTLKAWAVYAGDIQGSRPLDALESHVRRLTPADTPREALESLALQVTLASEPIFDPHKARQWVKSFEPNEPEPINEMAPDAGKGKRSDKNDQDKVPTLGLISKMVESGLLCQHRNNHTRFVHPIFAGYLTGKSVVNYTEAINSQPPCIGKNLAFHYLAAQEDATKVVETLLSQPDRPLSRNLLLVARWLRDAPIKAPWRAHVMTKLAELLQQNGQPLGLRGQALTAFIQSSDPGPTVLFRQLLLENDVERLQLAALGSGAMRDTKSIEHLSALLGNPNSIVRRAASLALAAIGTTSAMDALASGLLHGDENLRQAAAEAMSNHPGEGHKMLKEGAEMKDDLNVRRAVIFGLGRVHQPWAEELINKIQLEDDQWIVRNAALEILEEHLKPNKYLPRRLPPPSESPWLIAYAGEQGVGISPNVPPTDLLLRALKTGNLEEKVASLSYLRTMPSEGVYGALYNAMYGDERELREEVFRALTEMASRGADIPDPVQFGLGN